MPSLTKLFKPLLFFFERKPLVRYLSRLHQPTRVFMTSSIAPKVTVVAAPNPDEFGELANAANGASPNYTVTDPLDSISGFTDYTISEMRVMNLWREKLGDLFKIYGFTHSFNRPVEYAINLQKTGGISKQMFGVSRMQDGGLTKVGLPFDRTVPMAILVARNAHQMKFPFARADWDWSWRGEHAVASTGRYRAFIQYDTDYVAIELTARADAQCIVAMIKGLEKLGVPQIRLLLNHIDLAKFFMQGAGIPKERFNDALRAIDKLKSDNFDEVVQELCESVPGLNECEAAVLLKKMSYRGSLTEFEFPNHPTKEAVAALDHLKEIEQLAHRYGISPQIIQFAPNLTRGLNYYTGVVFETFIPGREKYGSIASGGRYDDLVSEFNPSLKLQGVGGSIGVTRLFDVMKAEGLIDLSRQTSAQVFVGYRTRAEEETADFLATALREKGIYCEIEVVPAKVKKLLELADGKGIPFTLLVMNPDEIILKETRVKKNSAEQTEQVTFGTIQQAVEYVEKLKTDGELDAPLAFDSTEVDSKSNS